MMMSSQLFSRPNFLRLGESLVKQTNLRCLLHSQPRRCSLYEPDYLESMKPKIPLYDKLNVQIKGYNFTILENYQRLVNSLARSMDVEVENGWATPPESFRIQKFKPESLVVNSEYKLTVFERNIQISNLPSTTAPILFEVLKAGLPEGVNLRIHRHEPEHEEIRYVPDRELIELKTELDTLGGPSTKKK